MVPTPNKKKSFFIVSNKRSLFLSILQIEDSLFIISHLKHMWLNVFSPIIFIPHALEKKQHGCILLKFYQRKY